MKKRLKNISKAKKNLTIVILFMLFLFTYCYLMYTGVGNRLDETYQLNGGSDLISQRLQEIIPYSSKNDLTYMTAYQTKNVTKSDISNDILLTIAYYNSSNKSANDFKDVIDRYYGATNFLINKNFSVNSILECTYEDVTLTYNCKENKSPDLLYDVARKIDKLIIKDNKYYLTEKVAFYEKEIKNDEIIYKIYNNANYQNVVGEFK